MSDYKSSAVSNYNISGIQQVGVGVTNVDEAFAWYRKNFGMDVAVFDDRNVAKLMVRYTGGEAFERRALLALNMKGGGGFEIWQFTGRTPTERKEAFDLGNLGIFTVKMGCGDVDAAHALHKKNGVELLCDVQESPAGEKHYFVRDPYGNIFEICSSAKEFQSTKHVVGGVHGAIMTVSDIDESLKLYKDVLGYSEVKYDTLGTFEDLKGLPGGEQEVRRVLLENNNPKGPFCELFGKSAIELVQTSAPAKEKLLEGRFWGDPGFIHLCYDVQGMKKIGESFSSKGYDFTVDSADSFDMGKAAGHFTYIEDKDGTLIELVETHKMPLLQKIGLSLDLKKRKPGKPIPKWILNFLSLKRVK